MRPDCYVNQIGGAKQAVDYGDACWSKVLMNWSKWRDEGLTAHRYCRPDGYQAACRHWGIAPDPQVLSYATSCEQVRADLKNLSTSG